MNVAICDDSLSERRTIQEWITDYLGERPQLAGQLFLFENGKALLDAVKKRGGFDLYLLDVIMPEMNGIQSGLKLRELGAGGEIIYLTSSKDYAVDSYYTNAFFYLLKPVERKVLFSVLDKAAEKLNRRRREKIVIKTSEGQRCILLDQILLAERKGHSVQYYCTEETVNSLTFQSPFREVMTPLLADRRFYLCGVSLVCNLQRISAITGQNVVLDNGISFTVPRRGAAALKAAWGGYWLTEGER